MQYCPFDGSPVREVHSEIEVTPSKIYVSVRVYVCEHGHIFVKTYDTISDEIVIRHIKGERIKEVLPGDVAKKILAEIE